MPLMKLACTALERVPLTRPKIIEHLLKKFHQDLVFCRAPGDDDLTIGVLGMYTVSIYIMPCWIIMNLSKYSRLFECGRNLVCFYICAV